MTVSQRLYTLSVPGEWQRTGLTNNTMIFALPSVYPNVQNHETNHDVFYVHILAPEQCTKAFADKEAQTNWGEKIRANYRATPITDKHGGAMGYTWAALDGVGGGATLPTYRHWCIHNPEQWMDLDITAFYKDVNTKKFVEETFIPLWLGESN